MHNVMRQIRSLMDRAAAGAQSDDELLRRFVVHGEEEAFALLVRRHGPMVLGVCLRLLRHRQDAEDAFQASFLTLARKGHTIRRRGALPGWLYRVAYRIALRLKARAERRGGPELLGEVAVDCDPADEAGWRELRPLLDQEIARLPSKYRLPMVLCYLEGKTYEEAAAQMGCPKGTVSVRLLRARALLKARLVRRGLFAAAGCVAGAAVVPAAGAAVPAALAAKTVASAGALVAGAALAEVASGAVAVLVDETVSAMWLKKVQVICAAAVGLGLSALGVGGPALISSPREQAAPAATAEPTPRPAPAEAAVAEPEIAPPDVGLCVMEVDLHGGRADPEPPRPGLAIGIAGGALDAAERGGAAQAFRLCDEDGRTLVLLLNPRRAARPAHGAAGLALRGRLLDDEPAPTPPEPAAAPTRPAPRAVVFAEHSRLTLFGGRVRIIFLAPVCWARAEATPNTVFIF